jgi:hypothetical protein
MRPVWAIGVLVGACIGLCACGGREDTPTQAQAAAVPSRPEHTLFDEILRAHVQRGLMDYRDLKAKDAGKLQQYLQQLAAADPTRFASRDDELAFWLNAYNAGVISKVLARYPDIKSVMDVKGFFDAKDLKVAGRARSLGEIENQIIRPKFKDPRVHWILVCAAMSCPPLPNRAMEGATLQKQLDAAARFVVNNDKYVQIDQKAERVRLSRIMSWYKQDFVDKHGSLEAFMLRYAEPARRKQLEAGKYAIEFMQYDWALNDAGRAGAK